MIRRLAWLSLAAMLAGQALAAPSGQRLASIKQHALALHTVSLSDTRRFARNAIVLLDWQHNRTRPEHLRLWLNGELWFDYGFGHLEARHLQSRGTQYLGLAPLPAGRHELRAELRLSDAENPGARAFTVHGQAALSLPDWPRGVSLQVQGPRNGQPELRLLPRIDGEQLLRAAEQALELGLAGRALSILQTLGQVEAGLTGEPRHTLLMGRSLRGWGLDRAAESMFAQLLDRGAPAAREGAARLQAAELALSLNHLAAARRYLDWPERRWPEPQRGKARVLHNRLLLAEGKLSEAGRQIPQDAPLLWQYNLAIALLQADQAQAGERLLRRIGDSGAADPQSAAVRALANLKLGYWLLARQRPGDAYERLGRVGPESARHAAALLGRGWAALARLDADAGTVREDDLRPAFIQRIDAAVQQAPPGDREQALLRAVESWTRLRDGDPLDPAVQEALVAIPYALAQLGADARAIAYAELAVERLDAARLGPSRIYTRSVRGETLDAVELAAGAWPPQPMAWRERTHTTAWWMAESHRAPDNAHLRQMLADGETLRILHNMSVLREAQAMIEAAATAPDLEHRAGRLLRRIDAEREVQQKTLNRFIWTWLDRRGTQTRRYLIMARLVLGQVAARQDPR